MSPQSTCASMQTVKKYRSPRVIPLFKGEPAAVEQASKTSRPATDRQLQSHISAGDFATIQKQSLDLVTVLTLFDRMD